MLANIFKIINKQNITSKDLQEEKIIQYFKKKKLDINRIYLNPGSTEDYYDFLKEIFEN